MKRLLGYLLFVVWALPGISRELTVAYPRCEFRTDPLGIDVLHPRLSWELYSTGQNVLQTAYRILVADDVSLLQKNTGNIWDSRKVISSASIQVAYAGKALQPAKKYYWKVMLWDNKGKVSAWSITASWQMGLLSAKDWGNAKWIAYDVLPDSARIVPAEHGNGKREWGKRRNILPLLRKTFSIDREIKQATAFISGLGQFEMSINGKKLGDHFLDPGWTRYDKNALYVTFDITEYLHQGPNAVGVMLGNGLYYLPGERYRKMTGAYGYPKMITRIVVAYKDGSSENIVSDENWKTAPSPVIFSSMYGGEDYDATLEQEGWNTASFNDNSWKNAVMTEGHLLQSQTAEPIKVMQEFTPVKTTQLKNNLWVYDMGQNMSGIPQIAIKGNRGDTIRITAAELLKEDGTANQRATGSPSYFQYILKGNGIETWQPRFTYYGFRYVQVDLISRSADTSVAGLPSVISIKGLHTRNSMSATGSFNCSGELFNKTFDLILWSINSNTQSIFTDCPHRERLGWQEEVHLMGNSVKYNYELLQLAQKIFRDIKAGQTKEGLVTSTVPEFTEMHFANGYFRDSPEWGSNCIIFPWYIYQWYGDKQALADNYDVMQRYINYLDTKDSSYLLMYGLSDWYDLGPQRPGFCQLTPIGLTATAYYYYDLVILEKIARLLGKTNDAAKYAAWAIKVKNAFNQAFYHPDTRQYGTGSQTSNAIAVYMGMVPPKDKQAVIENIIKDLRRRDNSLTSGDIGYRYLLKVLDDAGRSDVIFDMNSRSDVPGYGYQIAKGATALTESWQALPIVSNNHLMLGHLMEWFYEGLAGIKQSPDSIAYKKIEIRPQPAGDITFANASYHSPYGEIRSDWKRTGKSFELNVTIPVNTTAEIFLPANTKYSKPVKVGSGMYRYVVDLK
ncbi:MAG: family 78 glycoside hydrolase catalytic domain [Chitinophagaceae bacterium]|nr:family 78 glycoside hydrolase catalytic domain [Chitinophagaceae bacterium]